MKKIMGDGVMQILAKPIQLAEHVTKLPDDAYFFRAECKYLKIDIENLAVLLRQAAGAELYERPTRRIMDDIEQVLDKALALVTKCRANGLMKRMFTIIPAVSFRKMSTDLYNSIAKVSWLLRLCAADDMHLGLLPFAHDKPILFQIWEHIVTLHNGSLNARADAAASLVSLTWKNKLYCKLIIEEDGVGPLLRLVKDGRIEGQKKAAQAIGHLGQDSESVEQIVIAGVCSVFSKVLKDGPMKVQAKVAWAISKLVDNHPKCQDVFAENNVVHLLIRHLAFETIHEHSKYNVPPKVTSIHGVVKANNNPTNITENFSIDSSEHPVVHPTGSHAMTNQVHNVIQSTMTAKGKLPTIPSNPGPNHQYPTHPASDRHQYISLDDTSIMGREFEDSATKTKMKVMAAYALCQLSRGNSTICKIITKSKALLCFAVLLEKGEEDVQYNSALAIEEIARVAEEDADLRRSAFKSTSPTARAVVDQLVRIVIKEDNNALLVPCIKALGCLSKTFRASETRIICPLVRLLNNNEENVMLEASIALTKFSCTNNYLHLDHSKAIIKAGGAKHIVQLVSKQMKLVEQILELVSKQKMQVEYLNLQVEALIQELNLLCYIALHVPDSEELAEVEVLVVLESASKQTCLIQNPKFHVLLTEAKQRLELYQSIGSRKVLIDHNIQTPKIIIL